MAGRLPIAILAATLAAGGCAWWRDEAPRDAPATPVAASSPVGQTAPEVEVTPAPAASSPPVAFADELKPLLQQRCGKCHFPGGRMHGRLPFDDEATVRTLGRDKLYTRIEDDEGRRVVNAWFDALPR